MEPVLLGKIVVFVRMAEGGRLNLNSWTWTCRRAAMFLALLVTSGLRLKTTSRDMEARLRVCERALQNLVVDWRFAQAVGGSQRKFASNCLRCPLLRGALAFPTLGALAFVTEWFYSTRLETRTKESNTCASLSLSRLKAQ